ncbi:hypothetical protein PLICRDRAFT_117058 [Plicaturopsis crispa FD-325 SS-3]|uniref:F-box domain-containing protein n=1 Tax=Plicaturopsis crispa FD-325 SS-3 TaxID=944288 RepID=A0A0C9SRL7_PLICR|nr:hypothetical protein PLICRDRAFT_117058 [Plicaturopsis crispa FD-325 SS-3]
MTTQSPALYPAFPVELLDEICQQCDQRRALLDLQLANSHLRPIAQRVLYRSITDISPSSMVSLFRSLCSSQITPRLVRELAIDWQMTCPTGNLYRLVNRTLRRLTFLKVLSIEPFRGRCDYRLVRMLDGCTFRLERLATSIPCDDNLAEFLNKQPLLRELDLHGHCLLSDSGSPLSPLALPQLASFRAVHAGPDLIERFVRGRPVRNVSLSLYPSQGLTSFYAIMQSTSPLVRLTIMSFELEPRFELLLRETARYMPSLQALHIVELQASYNTDMLLAAAPLLEYLPELRYITLISAGQEMDEAAERSVAIQWSKANPSIRTIILPRGKGWFQRDGAWLCWNDSSVVISSSRR